MRTIDMLSRLTTLRIELQEHCNLFWCLFTQPIPLLSRIELDIVEFERVFRGDTI